jgi:hypothetical protein
MDGVPRRRRTTALAPRWQRAVLHLTGRDHDGGARQHRAGRHTAGPVQYGHGGYRNPHRAHELGYCSGRETVPDYQRQIAGNIFSERDSELAPGRAEVSPASAEVDGQALLDCASIAQIVLESDDGIVDEDVERVDCPLDFLKRWSHRASVASHVHQ